MGRIIKMHNKGDNKVELTLEMSQNEVELLKGNLDKMHLFSELTLDDRTRIVNRGKTDSTKYFLIPREYKENLNFTNEVPCTKIETKTKCFYVFCANKY